MFQISETMNKTKKINKQKTKTRRCVVFLLKSPSAYTFFYLKQSYRTTAEFGLRNSYTAYI